MKTKERNVSLQVRCRICNNLHILKVTEESATEYLSSNRRHVQVIFPYLNAEERELLISHTCPKCWEDLFGSDEDEDYEEDYELTAEDLKEWQDASCGRV